MKEALANTSWAVEDTYKNMETLGEFISRKWNSAVASFVNRNNEWFQSTRELYHIIKDELTPWFEKAKEETTLKCFLDFETGWFFIRKLKSPD